MSMQGLTKFAYVEAEAYWLGTLCSGADVGNLGLNPTCFVPQ